MNENNKMIQELISPSNNHIFEINQKLKVINQTINNLAEIGQNTLDEKNLRI